MKPGDLAIVALRWDHLIGKTALILEVIPTKGPFVSVCRCLIDGKIESMPTKCLEPLNETG
jgi:hypothetical protein